MSTPKILADHHKWRRGTGGARAGLAGQSDGSSYAGLDLSQATFDDASFSGSGFTRTRFDEAQWNGCRFTGCKFTADTFLQASWLGCRFEGCTFDDCNLMQITIRACRFEQCLFSRSKLARCEIDACEFTHCDWSRLNFDHGRWSQLRLMGCRGREITAERLVGTCVDYTGSRFELVTWSNVLMN
jgi:uncharacterized protein YjbI with pentapeptide repeats